MLKKLTLNKANNVEKGKVLAGNQDPGIGDNPPVHWDCLLGCMFRCDSSVHIMISGYPTGHVVQRIE
ncbi:MAG: hypothetical protein GY765_23500 [bacterium]|nr:hypothetical protein [bacterium]